MGIEIQEFKRVAESGDAGAVMSHFADDAVLHSPLTFVPFEGKDAVARLIGIIVEVLDGFHYTDELSDDSGRTFGLIFRAKIGDKDVEGLDLIRLNEDGKIQELTVMVRPRSSAEALLEAVGGRLMAAD